MKMDRDDEDGLRVAKPRDPLNVKSLSTLLGPQKFDKEGATNHELRRAIEITTKIAGKMIEQLCMAAHKSQWQIDQLCHEVDQLKRGGGAKVTGRVAEFVKLLTPECQAFNPPDDPPHLARHPNEETDVKKEYKEIRDEIWKDYAPEWTKKNKTWGKLTKEMQADICQRFYDAKTKWPWQVTIVRTTEEISNVRKKKRKAGKPRSRGGVRRHEHACTNSKLHSKQIVVRKKTAVVDNRAATHKTTI